MALWEDDALKGEDELVSFGNWPTVLAQADLPFEVKRDYKRDILGLLRACKDARRPQSVGFIQWHLSRRGLSETERSYERESYKWLFREARRASAATQKQALNALAFFMQQALRIDLGDLAFRRARPRRKLPVVLSRDEVARLLAAMPRGYRLMGEVMYGSGLRLMELLRLRVHHLDLERRQVAVYAGKGAKDRVTVMSESLVPKLTAHLEVLREIFAQDRAANAPGVWLPDGLARKSPKAGEQWQWQWLFP